MLGVVYNRHSDPSNPSYTGSILCRWGNGMFTRALPLWDSDALFISHLFYFAVVINARSITSLASVRMCGFVSSTFNQHLVVCFSFENNIRFYWMRILNPELHVNPNCMNHPFVNLFIAPLKFLFKFTLHALSFVSSTIALHQLHLTIIIIIIIIIFVIFLIVIAYSKLNSIFINL